MVRQYGGPMQTLYDNREKKGIKVEFSDVVAEEIEKYLNGLDQVMKLYKDNEEITKGLQKIKVKANTVLVSHTPEDEIMAEIRKLTTITTQDGKKLNISNFHTVAKVKTSDKDEYKKRALKKISQTVENGFALIQWKNDPKLEEFVKNLKKTDPNISAKALDGAIKDMVHSEGFKHYLSLKADYIKEWLKPFQEEIGKPIESLSQEDLQTAMKRMKIVMSQRMKEGDLTIHENSESFKNYNAHDHDMVTGNNKDFWLNDQLADEFVNFTKTVVNRFTFMMDKQFLVFQFQTEPYLYLLGFSHDAFLTGGQGNSLVIEPHLKALIKKDKEATFRELNGQGFTSKGLYIDVLKDTLKPFFKALGEKISFEFSPEFQRHFRM